MSSSDSLPCCRERFPTFLRNPFILQRSSRSLRIIQPQIRKLREKRSKASREILHLAAEAKLAAKLESDAVSAYVTFEEEDAAIAARVRTEQSLSEGRGAGKEKP